MGLEQTDKPVVVNSAPTPDSSISGVNPDVDYHQLSLPREHDSINSSTLFSLDNKPQRLDDPLSPAAKAQARRNLMRRMGLDPDDPETLAQIRTAGDKARSEPGNN